MATPFCVCASTFTSHPHLYKTPPRLLLFVDIAPKMEGRAALQPDQQESPGTTEEHTRQPQPQQAPSDDDHADQESDDGQGVELEFEFPFVSRHSTAAPADELFADGRIRPFFSYPVFFGHTTGTPAAQQPAHHHHPTPPPRVRGKLGRLFLEESRSRNNSSVSSSSTSEEGGGLDGAPPESYCLWTPAGSPRRRRRSGSVARWRRISELVVGRSDGEERFMFFPLPPPKAAAGVSQRHDDEPDNSREAKAAAAPYREELVGFFANVNGVTRSHQYPF
jgi:hypothetical protein